MIKLNDASFSFNKYNKEIIIVKNFNFISNKTERLYIKGDNGSGKTTLLKILAGFYKLNSGNYECDSKIGFIPTKLDNFLMPWYSVKQNLNFFKFKAVDINRDASNTEYLNFIKYFFPNEDTSFLHRKVYELSSGQKAVISFICSRLLTSEIYFFDELLANVSMSISEKIINYIVAEDMNIIFTVHCEEIGKQLCTKTLQIEDFQ